MRPFSNNQKSMQGFTLFGLLLYITLAATVLMALGELTLGVLTLSARADRDRSSMYTLLFLRAKLASELGYAESVTIPTLGNPSASLMFTSNGKTTTYTTGEGRLWKSEDFSEPVALTPEDVFIAESVFEVVETNSPHPSIRWMVKTGIYDPLRAGVVLPHATTTVTWYPYVNI